MLIAATVVLVVGLAVFAYWEVRTSQQIVYDALARSGASLAEAVARGGENALRANDEIEDAVSERLLNNARLIRDIERYTVLSDTLLARLAEENDLFRINVFNASGNRVASNASGDGRRPIAAPRGHVDEVLSGAVEEKVVGLKNARFESGNRFAAAIRRFGGGAIVVNVDAAHMLAFRKAAGVGRLIQEIGENPGVVYVVLQDLDGIVAASKGIATFPRLADDEALLETLAADHTLTRMWAWQNSPVFETAKPFAIDPMHDGLLRIGLAPDLAVAQEVRVRWHLSMLCGLVVLLVSVSWLLAKAQRERELLQADLKRRDRLAAMGELASGVAHEVRNPLNAIAMIVQRLEREFEPQRDEDDYRHLTKMVRDEVKRVNGIVQQFLTFARPPALKFERVDMATLLNEILDVMAARVNAAGLTLERDIAPVGAVRLDAEQMKQAVINLVENAVAATAKGTILVGCTRADGNRVCIEVADTGTGIAPELQERIFDLYFTTKAEGSGLGLSLVHRIVTEHGGRLEVNSEAGKGTRFRILLEA